MISLLNTLFTIYMWFVGIFGALIIGLLLFMAVVFVLGQTIILASKLRLLLKTACAKVLLKAGIRSAPSANHGV